MERRDFIKLLGVGAVVIALPPIIGSGEILTTPLAEPRIYRLQNLAQPERLFSHADGKLIGGCGELMVHVGNDAVPVVKLLPGEVCLFRTDMEPVLVPVDEGDQVNVAIWCLDGADKVSMNISMVE